jgi:nicotinate-nucleotide adenylyltransferase
MIGIFGGTFDPVHFGHLRPALEVLQGLSLQQVRWIPSRQPPHRGAPDVSPEHRAAMVRLAIQGVDGFILDTRELDREGPSYMADSLRSLRKEFADDSLCLLLGMDAFAGFTRWHQWQDILGLAHMVVCHRPGDHVEIPSSCIKLMQEYGCETVEQLRSKPVGCIYTYPVTQLEISATAIRDAYRSGRDARFLLPDAVHAYIRQNGLYGQ